MQIVFVNILFQFIDKFHVVDILKNAYLVDKAGNFDDFLAVALQRRCRRNARQNVKSVNRLVASPLAQLVQKVYELSPFRVRRLRFARSQQSAVQ